MARNKMRTLGIHRQYKIRVCKECVEILRIYEGSNDSIGNYVRYIQDNQIFTLAHNFDLAYTAYLRYKDDLMKDGLTLSDFASMVPSTVSTLEILPQNSDWSCPDPSRSLTSTSSGSRRRPLIVLRLHHSVDIVSTTNTLGVFLVNEVIVSALIGAAATIIVGVLAQRMRNNQKNKNYLRDKFGDQLQSLASSITSMCNHLDKALDPWDKTEIDFQVIHDCFEELKRCQPSIYVIGKRNLTRYFNDLFNALDYIEIHSSDDVWYLDVREECKKLPSLSGNLLREISSVQGY